MNPGRCCSVRIREFNAGLINLRIISIPACGSAGNIYDVQRGTTVFWKSHSVLERGTMRLLILGGISFVTIMFVLLYVPRAESMQGVYVYSLVYVVIDGHWRNVTEKSYIDSNADERK